MAQDQFDIACLREIPRDAESGRAALSAAMIKLHALSIARKAPELRGEAMEIVDYSRQLFYALPTRSALERLVGDQIDGPLRPVMSARHIERLRHSLVQALWRHLRPNETERLAPSSSVSRQFGPTPTREGPN